ncbi:MAG: hypothetical protein OSB02_07400 [Rhodospirillaceae bacterium]|nr:hypothetical protein [Rhodospirillaceae bacterium]
MAANFFTLSNIKKVLGLVSNKPAKMVSLGYPDIIVTEKMLRRILGDNAMEGLSYRSDGEEILKWHGMTKLIDKVPEAYDLFSRMGIELTVIDFKEVRGNEIIVDLNVPIPDELDGQFDIVFDGGTMEHCFNVAQAVINILGMAKVGGYIYHTNPLVVINHGFYSFSPTFYYDFYTQNGHKLTSSPVATLNVGLDTQVTELNPLERRLDIPLESCIAIILNKCNDENPKFPVQSKYLLEPGLEELG